MASCRPGRLPLFRARSPLGASLKRRRVSRIPLRLRKNSGFILLLVLSSTILVGLLVVSLHISSNPPPSTLSQNSSRSHIRRWHPPVIRGYRAHAHQFFPFLPDPDMFELDSKNLREYVHPRPLDRDGITAILPASADSLRVLKANLDSLLSVQPTSLHEIIVACHPNLVSTAERAVKETRDTLSISPPIVVLPWSQTDGESLGLLHVLPSIFTFRVLVLDLNALGEIDDVTRMTLLNAAPSNIPIGPHGFVVSLTNVSCIHSSPRTVPAAYLVPPFLSPASLLLQAENGLRLDTHTWAAVGERITKISRSGSGGLVMGAAVQSKDWCVNTTTRVDHDSTFLRAFYRLLEQGVKHHSFIPHIDILLPGREDLESFGPTVCEMANRGYALRIMLFSWHPWHPSGPSAHFALDVGCHLHFEIISGDSAVRDFTEALQVWLHAGEGNEILIYASQNPMQSLAVETSLENSHRGGLVLRLPLEDLAFCEWMATLSMSEWRNWHKPRIDLSVITNDRPHSLSRLLASLTATRYYGDPISLSINLEQTADAETRQIVAQYHWTPGVIQVKHRIISAGLLPAVVEAWYPHNNDTYGVLLEDDIELSPMFYAWIKMTILRYRYGDSPRDATSLFGISLYQPTNLELRVEGRVPFEPRILFAQNSLPDSHTPYLSQIPCSWGAVYFPEHWREFHDYLAIRLSEVSHNISEVIVPDIRSNRWSRSWKKYFNELAYLRGYVMLYPNYDESLATNHVELGAHVKGDPHYMLDSIRRQFDVRLMSLPSNSESSSAIQPGLLNLPAGSLPKWNELPVLDLWGVITSHQELFRRGQDRRDLLSGCPTLNGSASFTFDATELLCHRLPSQN